MCGLYALLDVYLSIYHATYHSGWIGRIPCLTRTRTDRVKMEKRVILYCEGRLFSPAWEGKATPKYQAWMAVPHHNHQLLSFLLACARCTWSLLGDLFSR